jgi:hypothetical protein
LKTERARQYVSISIRGTTQLSDIRWGFETTSCGFEDKEQQNVPGNSIENYKN